MPQYQKDGGNGLEQLPFRFFDRAHRLSEDGVEADGRGRKEGVGLRLQESGRRRDLPSKWAPLKVSHGGTANIFKASFMTDPPAKGYCQAEGGPVPCDDGVRNPAVHRGRQGEQAEANA
mmetsp:Transcript_6657/g.13864  ORF Transcript_6657/g.13864 Transcript_6657/m.13864 type:complete len:119 (-) Transcript_6657:40-396(-)